MNKIVKRRNSVRGYTLLNNAFVLILNKFLEVTAFALGYEKTCDLCSTTVGPLSLQPQLRIALPTLNIQLIADDPKLQISCYGICIKFAIPNVLIL